MNGWIEFRCFLFVSPTSNRIKSNQESRRPSDLRGLLPSFLSLIKFNYSFTGSLAHSDETAVILDSANCLALSALSMYFYWRLLRFLRSSESRQKNFRFVPSLRIKFKSKFTSFFLVVYLPFRPFSIKRPGQLELTASKTTDSFGFRVGVLAIPPCVFVGLLLTLFCFLIFLLAVISDAEI